MARPPSVFVSSLTEADREVLRHLKDHGETCRIRERAHAMLLSGAGKTVNEIADVLETTRESVTAWIRRWEDSGPLGLADKPRCGAPPTFNEDEREEILKLIEKHPHSPKQVRTEIRETMGKATSASTLRRIARAAGLRWKRMRKSLRSQRDEKAFRKAQKELDEFIELHMAGEFDLYYFDEAGFSLTPTVPYAWQPQGETQEIPSQKSRRINVLGFLRYYDNKFVPYTVDGSIDSEIVIACFDDFCRTRRRPAIVVIDNASVHTSAAFDSRVAKWEEKGVFPYFLPPYCPELNLIEILWRMIKYQWLPLDAYDSFQKLVESLHEVLWNVGSYYAIDFATSDVAS